MIMSLSIRPPLSQEKEVIRICTLKLQGHSRIFAPTTLCPRQTVFVGDYEVAVMRSPFVHSFKTFSYLLNQTSEVHETLLVLFLCQ